MADKLDKLTRHGVADMTEVPAAKGKLNGEYAGVSSHTRVIAAALVLVLSASLGMAEDKDVTVIERVVPLKFSTVLGMDTLAIVNNDGAVLIDWDAVERWSTAQPGKTMSYDATLATMAKLMLATRDGTWKPLKDGKPQ